MTTLDNGRIIAPFAELIDGQKSSVVRMLISEDNGENWGVEQPTVLTPLVWWVPCGKIVESDDNTLYMPVFGAISHADLKATIHNCGLLRSRDGGKTWRHLSWIARGPGPMIGAEPSQKFSFEGPLVQTLPDGRWLAIATARRLNEAGDGPTRPNEGPGAPQALCRLWSRDHGKTWTEPDQLLPGAWPGLAVAGQDTILASTQGGAWAVMWLLASRDGFETFYQQAPMLKRGWRRGYAKDVWPYWGTRKGVKSGPESPLAPSVPYLGRDWRFEHYGYPSVLPLDQDRLLVAFGEPQRGTFYVEGSDHESLKIPWDKERITAVFYRRVKVEGELAPPLADRPQRPAGRWVLSERRVVDDLGGLAQTPDGDLLGEVAGKIQRSSDGGRSWEEVQDASIPPGGMGAFGVLRSGRWLAAAPQWRNLDISEHPNRNSSVVRMGVRGGYPLFKEGADLRDPSLVVSYSDDEGRTWQAGKPFKGPFQWILNSVCHFIECADGTIALPVNGCVTNEEGDSGSSSNGVIRSKDGGRTWGDFSFVFRTRPKGPTDFQPEPRYTEMDIIALPNGHWVAFSRTESIMAGPRGWGDTELVLSTDLGRTWRKTGGSLVMVHQQRGVMLSDGGIAITYRPTTRHKPAVLISYDEGRSFDYGLAGPPQTINAFAIAADEFVVFAEPKSYRSDATAAYYRWKPHSAN
jgi:hypothetical protein